MKGWFAVQHDLTLAESVADRVYIFDENHRIIIEGEPEAILQDHALMVECNLAPDHIHQNRERAAEHTQFILHPQKQVK